MRLTALIASVSFESKEEKLIICRSGQIEPTQGCMCMYGAFGVLGSDERHGSIWRILTA